ncbi:MAG: hypothetical protein JKY37_23495 [Nannocystaceae bacterium]|nr:hypothetical protein [Nannocystaceae bacterium]
MAVAAILVWMSRGLANGESLADHVGRVQLQWLALSIALSLQDVGTDALALDRIEPRDRGLANGVMLGGHHLGAEGLGGMAVGAAVVAAGASWGLAAMAVVFAALAVVPMLLPVAQTSGRPRVPMALGPALKSMFSTPAARLGFTLAAVVMLADVATSAVSGAFWVQRLGWGPERIAGELAPLVLGSSVVGYLIAALVVDRLGHASATWVGAAALGALWVAFALAEPLWSVDAFMWAFVGLQTVATALMYVGVHALLMGATSPKVRATHFAVLMALLNLPRVLVPPLAPALLGALGFAGLFAACGVFQLGVGLWVRRAAL